MNTDTIAAIATALSNAGIGIIRISGEKAVEVGDCVFCTPGGRRILREVESHTIHYGYVVNPSKENEIIDEVMVSVMRKPRSFTAEDTVEIHCHGGILVVQKILEIVCDNGARLAEPGEFTKRAFLNGRIDLSKAEAVMDVIHSQNELALKCSVDQLQGKLSEKIRMLREKLIYEIAYIESALDDPEHISLDGYAESLYQKIKEIKNQINDMIVSSANGRLIKEGISTVILGKPNVGKSSLLNMLLGEDRAIVTDIAGTTRDVLQESIRLNGIQLNIVDTAGIRTTEDVVEKIGVEKAKKYAEDADLILCVVDSSQELDDNDREIFSFIDNFSLIDDKKSIILFNKSDLEQKVKEEQIPDLNKSILIRTSTRDGGGIKELCEVIKNMFFEGMIESKGEPVITNLRHRRALSDAFESLELVLKSVEDGMPEDFYSIDLMSAYSSLGLIIGEEVEDDLMNEIFGKFCMGK